MSGEGGQQAVASVTQSTVSDQVTSDQTDTQKEKIISTLQTMTNRQEMVLLQWDRVAVSLMQLPL